MKIRGNTVGTPLKPEVAVVKATNLTEEQKQKARENIDVPSYYELEDLRNDVLIMGSKHDEDILALDTRLDELGNGGSGETAEYRHIRTYEQTTDTAVKAIDITKDKDGNAFSCSEFMILLTLPTSDDVNENYHTQFYIGKTLSWSEWIALFRQAFSRTVQRKWRIHIRHWYDGWWIADGSMSEDTADYAVKDTSSFTFGNIKSQCQVGETINELHFMTTTNIPIGTIIEVYGK